MLKILLVLFLISTPVYAASVTLNFPDAEQTRILNGLTKDGANCNQGEALGACAKRMIINMIKQEVKAWDNLKARDAAIAALTPASDPNVS